jgi:hypothetical protein
MSETKTKKEEKAEEKKAELQPTTKHRLPEGVITPVQVTHKLKETVNPATGETYAKANLNSQLVYTLSKASKNNGMPVKHYDAKGKAHSDRVVEDNIVVTRPGFVWEELVEWWVNRPEKKAAAKSEEKDEETSASDDANELEELEEEDGIESEADEDDELVEAE